VALATALDILADLVDEHVSGLVGKGALRASFGVGSRLGDVERLVAGVEQLLDRGPRFEYARDAEGWGPRHDTRDVSTWPGLDPAA
jgi:hypothetical protein